MILGFERFWSENKKIPEIEPPEAPAGFGVWSVEFGRSGELADPVAYARDAVLRGADTVTLFFTVVTPAGERLRVRSISGVAPFSSIDTAVRLIAKAGGLGALFAGKAAATTPAEFFALFRRHAALSVADPAPKETGVPDATAHLRRLLREFKNDLFTRKQWRLLIGDNLDRAPEPERLVKVIPPRDRIWADPFPFEEPGKTWVFFEEKLFSGKHGRIAVGEWSGKTLKNVRTALDTGSHLSFPQIFFFGGKRRLLAEAAASGKLTVYESKTWPDAWEPGAVVFDRPILDPSLFEYAGRWWLFGNLAAAPGAKADEDLHVFFADDPLSGKWTPHPLNPVVTDARFARGAGRPFAHNGKLYRPAQDCAGGYGRRVFIREIVALTQETYGEKTAGKMDPSELVDAVGLHTLNPGRKHVASDYAVRVRRFF